MMRLYEVAVRSEKTGLPLTRYLVRGSCAAGVAWWAERRMRREFRGQKPYVQTVSFQGTIDR